MNFQQLSFIANSVKNTDMCSRILREHADMHDKKERGWYGQFHRIADWIDGGMSLPTPFRVFVKGNGKLPFHSFSTLPGASFCPGAGSCLNWCYSFKSWQYVRAFGRQLMNTMLIMYNRSVIESEWLKLPHNVNIRLYVDGDFGNVSELRFWMHLCSIRPDLKVYGYSKSFLVFLQAESDGIVWPDNYVLNLSGGHKYNDYIVEKMKELPVTRGPFIGIDIEKRVFSSQHGTPEVNRLLREKAKKMGLGKVFTCPGKCGQCTAKEHACGSKRFNGIPIVIAIH